MLLRDKLVEPCASPTYIDAKLFYDPLDEERPKRLGLALDQDVAKECFEALGDLIPFSWNDCRASRLAQLALTFMHGVRTGQPSRWDTFRREFRGVAALRESDIQL
jgi:hypothetical protein